MALKPGLYVTATPIGNLKDITMRAVETLRAADLILCEDTRVTAKLARAHDITTPRMAYHDHNAETVRPGILARLQDGQTICIVSDAGTPLISDPGYKLVRAVRDAGLPVFTLPGPSALTAALSIAGAPTDRFLFAGFLPVKTAGRRRELERLAQTDATLVFYESGSRLPDMLKDTAAILGNRQVAIARELTKLYEEVREGRALQLAEACAEEGGLKGEIVVAVHPPEPKNWSEEELHQYLAELLKEHKTKDASGMAAEATGLPRKQLYELALQIRGEGSTDA